MSLLVAGTIGFVVAIAVLQILDRDLVRIVVGLYILWNAVNLLVVAVGATRGVRAPLDDGTAAPMADPLVQAFVLTAIVITFGFTAFLAALVLWISGSEDSIDVEDLRREQH